MEPGSPSGGGTRFPDFHLCNSLPFYLDYLSGSRTDFIGRMGSTAKTDLSTVPVLFIPKSKLSQDSSGASKNVVPLREELVRSQGQECSIPGGFVSFTQT